MSRPIATPGLQDAKRHGHRAARSPALGWLARAGLVARGVVYGVVGVLALKLALGDGGRATDQSGALRTIAGQPFGRALLIALTVGLAGYVTWKLVRAAVGHGAREDDSTSDRIAAAAGGIAYAILCVAAVKILIGSGSSSGSPKQTTGGILDWSLGPLLVGAAGLTFIGVAAYQAHKGVTKRFLDDSETAAMHRSVKTGFTALGLAGHVARAIVFALVGYGLLRAAIEYDPQEAIGLDGALRKLAHASYGPALLGVVAAGLTCFAAYSMADARYRRV